MPQPSALRAFSSPCCLPRCPNSPLLCEVLLRILTMTLSVVLRKFLANLKCFYSRPLCHIWRLGLESCPSFVLFVRACVCVRESSPFFWPKPTQVTRGGLVWVDNSMVTPSLYPHPPSSPLLFPLFLPSVHQYESKKKERGPGGERVCFAPTLKQTHRPICYCQNNSIIRKCYENACLPLIMK